MGSRLMKLHTAEIQRRLKVNQKQSQYETIGTYKGYRKAVSEQDQNVGIDQFGIVYHFTIDDKADIQNGDLAIIDGKTYSVKSFAYKGAVSVGYTKLMLNIQK